MKTLAALILLAILPTIVVAQWSNDANQNTAIAIAAGEQVIPKVATHSDGTTYISWFSQEAGNYNVRLQKLDIFGNKLWDEAGLLVSNHTSMTWLTDWDMTVDLYGCPIVVFQDVRSGNNNIYAYRISPEGDFLWGNDGIALSNNSDFEAAPVVTTTQEGNAVFAWTRENTISMQKVNIYGEKQWGENGIQFQGPTDFAWPRIIPVNQDEILMTFFKQTGQFPAITKNVFVQRFNADGQGVWGDGIAITNNAGIPFYVQASMIPDGNNGAFVTWHRDNGSVFDAYVQHVKEDGNLSFPANGLALSLNTGSHQLDPELVFDADTEDLYAFWREHNANQSLRGISGQRISSAGTRLWGNNGKIIVAMQSGEKADLRVTITDNEPIIVFSDSPQGSPSVLIRTIRLDNNGDAVWMGGQRSISLASSNKADLEITNFVNGQIIVVWEDERNDGGDIYAQNLKPNGTLGPLQASLTVEPQLLQFLEPNHFIDANFVVKNNFPTTLAIDSMTEFGNINNLNLYLWHAFTDSLISFPVEFNHGDSLIFTVGWDILVAPGREYLYDTIFIWSGENEHHVIIELDPSNFPSGIEENHSSNDLIAWPNPFSEQINISFTNPYHEPATLQIFDKMGKMVNFFHIPPPGSENVRIVWDGRNASGNKSAPGVYFLRVASGTYQKVLRVLYMPE